MAAREGKEGDEILLLSIRAAFAGIETGSDGALPVQLKPIFELSSIKEVTADLLVAVIVKSLQYHGQDEFPIALPQNIAARHRICTLLAASVKGSD